MRTKVLHRPAAAAEGPRGRTGPAGSAGPAPAFLLSRARRAALGLSGAAALATLLVAGKAPAEVPLVCDKPHEVDKYQLLRRLSLDLRDRIPSIEEYEALDASESVPEALVDDYLGSDDFRVAMRRYHETMLWPNLGEVRLHGPNAELGYRFGGKAIRLMSDARSKLYRDDAGATCGDFEQTHFDPKYPGEFRPDPEWIYEDGLGAKHEGWRLVTPYWNPNIQIKVCAYDAQETLSVPGANGDIPCNTLEGNNQKACGCGPNLRFCFPTAEVAPEVDETLKAAMREQVNRTVDGIVTGERPYTDLLLATKAWENGPIAYWKKWLAPNASLAYAYTVPDPEETPSDTDWFEQETWKEVERGGLHAGVVTLPAYLLRFQTARARAHRFRINFMCEHFVAPAESKPTPGCSESSGDLTERCHCQYCHSMLEPMAAHFGLFAEAGTTQMTDPLAFPKERPSCIGVDSGFCGRFYVFQKDAHNPGWLIPYQYSDLHPEYVENLEEGPAKLAQEIIDDGTFARCAVKKAFWAFVKRDIRAAGEQADEAELLDELAKGFEASGYSFPWLVRAVVSAPQYRRVR